MRPGTLSLSIAGLAGGAEDPWKRGARDAVRWVGAAGFRGVHLDGTRPGLRARELDRSARRDLAGLLRRTEVALSGIDLWIPPAHFADPEHADRAVAAACQAAGLAGDLARLLDGSHAALCLSFPAEGADGAIAQVVQAAGLAGVRIADHRWPPRAVQSSDAIVGVGLDPATALLAGGDPSEAAVALGPGLVSARLSDASESGRVVAGGGAGGRLDVGAYAASLLAGGYEQAVVLDLRGIADVEAGVRDARAAWAAAQPFGAPGDR